MRSGEIVKGLPEGPTMILLQEIEDITSHSAAKAPEGSASPVDHKARRGILVVGEGAMGLQPCPHGLFREYHSTATNHVFNGVAVFDLCDVCFLNGHRVCPSVSSGVALFSWWRREVIRRASPSSRWCGLLLANSRGSVVARAC